MLKSFSSSDANDLLPVDGHFDPSKRLILSITLFFILSLSLHEAFCKTVQSEPRNRPQA